MESRWKTFGAAIWLMVVSTGWVAADDEITPREGLAPVTAKLEALIRRVMKDQDLPAVSIALVDDQQVVWAKGFGLARPREEVAATAETVYRVGSVSKLFTDLAVMQLVEEGQLDLDAPVARYLPDFTPGNPFGDADHAAAADGPPLGAGPRAAGRQLLRPDEPPRSPTRSQSLNGTELVYAAGRRGRSTPTPAIAVVGRVVEASGSEPFAASLTRTRARAARAEVDELRADRPRCEKAAGRRA